MRRGAIAIAASILAVALAAQPALGDYADDGGGGGDIGPGDGGGATMTVGLTVTSPGSGAAYSPDDPAAPRPIRYEAVPASSPTGPGLENLCNASGAAATPDDPPFGWWYTVIAIDTFTGEVISTRLVCVPFADPANPVVPAPPDLAAPPTIGQIWDAVGIPAPAIGVSPAGEGVTGLDTWLWAGGPTTREVAVSLDGWTVMGTARLAEWRFDPGDATPVIVTATPGTPDTGEVSHLYEVKGTYRLSVSALWVADVALAGPGMAPRTTQIGGAVVTAARDYRVVEVRSVLLP